MKIELYGRSEYRESSIETRVALSAWEFSVMKVTLKCGPSL
jgi:hypothetical protein